VAIAIARQRLMTALYDYYELAHPDQGVGSGFRYKTVPHVTLKSIANDEPPAQETLYDRPFVDKSRARVSGPFTVEAVPAPAVKPLSLVDPLPPTGDASVARSEPTARHAEWLPFEPGEHRRIAVKIVDDRGIESLRIEEIADSK
jgi:adenine-specific DNA-methyltransferase